MKVVSGLIATEANVCVWLIIDRCTKLRLKIDWTLPVLHGKKNLLQYGIQLGHFDTVDKLMKSVYLIMSTRYGGRDQTCLLKSEEKKAKQGASAKRKNNEKNKDLNKDGKQDSEDGEDKKHKDGSKREDYVYDEQGRQRVYCRNCKKKKIINR